MDRIWYLMNNLLAAGESVVMATVFNKSGSAPRADGAKMLIQADGNTTGTIGGGKLETEVRLFAAEVFEVKLPLIHKFDLLGFDVAGMDMICGGSGEVLLDYFDAADQANLKIVSGIVHALSKREKAWLITEQNDDPFEERTMNKCLIKMNGPILGQFACQAEILAQLAAHTTRTTVYSNVWEDKRYLIEPIYSACSLYIFGAGHVSKEVAGLAEKVGFRTTVLDDRPEYACRERFPDSDVVLLQSFDDLVVQVKIDRESYIVIVTRGHAYDKKVLGQILRIPSVYVGMIGSPRKKNMIYSALQEELGFEADDFARIYCPVGIDILAESPEEIAVSIVAQLIKVRAEREKCKAIESLR